MYVSHGGKLSAKSVAHTACARTQVTFGPATPVPAPVDRPRGKHRLNVYRVISYACLYL